MLEVSLAKQMMKQQPTPIYLLTFHLFSKHPQWYFNYSYAIFCQKKKMSAV